MPHPSDPTRYETAQLKASTLMEALPWIQRYAGAVMVMFLFVIGLEMRPRRMREAAALWQRIADTQGIAARDLLWTHPDLLPRDSDIDDIDGFLATGSEDLMAELNKAIESSNEDPETDS
jgi:hypothetical protein